MSDNQNFDPASLGITVDPEPAQTAAPRAPTGRRKASRKSSDQLGIVWVHGSLHIGVLRQKKMLDHWVSPTPVRTVEEFAAAMTEALANLEFVGMETFLVLEGEPFVHQTESAPGFSNSATRHYLQGRIDRYAKEHEPVLWVAQPTLSPKKDERAFILHLLPQSFYTQLNRVLLDHRLDLTRILPMAVPIQRELNGFPMGKGEAALVAVEAADATIVIVAKLGGQILFARTILASLATEGSRVAIEINRSLLYAKQQFGESVDRIWLLTRTGRALEPVKAKCGAGKTVMVLPTQPEEWLQTMTRVAPNQPINLVANYRARKLRQQFLRRALLAAAWLGLSWMIYTQVQDAARWQEESDHFASLRGNEEALVLQHEKLSGRNTKLEREQDFIRQVGTDTLPPVPGKFLAYLASVLPGEIRLTEFSVKYNGGAAGWTVQFDGVVNADDETARELLTALQKHLMRSPVRARFSESARAFSSVSGGVGLGAPEQQRFSMEGVILEN